MMIMSHRSNRTSHRRDAYRIARTAVLPMYSPKAPLRAYEDRRLYHPLRQHRPAQFIGPRQSLVVRKVKARPFSSATAAGIAFARPRSVVVCVRRSRRKEVLHALNKTGKVGQKRPRWNYLSTISCRS